MHGLLFSENLDIKRREMRKLLLPFLYHDGAELARIDWGIADARHEVRNSTDVVKVAVRDEEAADFTDTFFQIFRIREDIINAGSSFFFKLQARVHDDDVVFIFNGGHVAPDFFNTAKRNDAERITQGWDF